MSPPVKTSMQWKQLAATSDSDPDGTLHLNLHMLDTTSGHDFVVSVSGHGKLGAEYWIGALTAAADMMRNAAGMAPQNSTLVPPHKSH